jgi:TonB-dependent SusC/RagA subfamily outer membrane receptor
MCKPGDIENITILKDVASTAIYGAEGANGVILITTVRAKFNQSQWNLKTAIGFSNITKSLPMMSPEDYMSSMMMEFYMRNQYRRDEVDFYQEYADQIWNTTPHRFKNYEDEVMKTSIRNTYDLSFNGGSDILKNATFLSYMSDDGIAINTGFDRLYLKSNSFVKASQKITFDANLQYSRTERLGLHWSAC